MIEREDVARDHERLHDWDAAYLLGALAPAERRVYEGHIAVCPVCTAAVGDLAGVPALLGALPRAHAMALLDGGPDAASSTESMPAAPDLAPALLGRVRRIRRRRRWTTVVIAAAAAAAVVAIALVVPVALTSPSGPTVTASLQQTAPSASRTPLTADITLTSQKWGTSIGMVCRWNAVSSWAPAAGAASRWDYGLWIVTADGRSERVATWSAGPGDVVHTTDSTDVPLDRIVRLELRAIDGKTVLLAADVHGTS